MPGLLDNNARISSRLERNLIIDHILKQSPSAFVSPGSGTGMKLVSLTLPLTHKWYNQKTGALGGCEWEFTPIKLDIFIEIRDGNEIG